MVGRSDSFWESLFSGAMLVSQSVMFHENFQQSGEMLFVFFEQVVVSLVLGNMS